MIEIDIYSSYFWMAVAGAVVMIIDYIFMRRAVQRLQAEVEALRSGCHDFRQRAEVWDSTTTKVKIMLLGQ